MVRVIFLKIAVFVLAAGIVMGQNIFDNSGKPFAKRVNQTMEPKIVVARTQMSSGYGSVSLNDAFRSGAHNVLPTSNVNLYVAITPVLVDSTATPPAYGYTISQDRKRVIISSSNANDTNYVNVITVMR